MGLKQQCRWVNSFSNTPPTACMTQFMSFLPQHSHWQSRELMKRSTAGAEGRIPTCAARTNTTSLWYWNEATSWILRSATTQNRGSNVSLRVPERKKSTRTTQRLNTVLLREQRTSVLTKTTPPVSSDFTRLWKNNPCFTLFHVVQKHS